MFKVRTVRRSDGRIEVHRVLTFDGLAESTLDDPITYERMIVWLEDPRDWSFVREATVEKATSRRGPLHVQGAGRVVGYSKLTSDAPTSDGKYVRRVFFLRQDDQPQQAPERFPSNAVDPRRVVPGVVSTRLQ